MSRELKRLLRRIFIFYNLALQEVRNPNLAAQIAAAVTMVINTNIPEQPAINPLAAFFAQLAEQRGKEPEPGEKEENGHDRTENAADKRLA